MWQGLEGQGGGGGVPLVSVMPQLLQSPESPVVSGARPLSSSSSRDSQEPPFPCAAVNNSSGVHREQQLEGRVDGGWLHGK